MSDTKSNYCPVCDDEHTDEQERIDQIRERLGDVHERFMVQEHRDLNALLSIIDAKDAEIAKLTARCDAYKGQVEAGAAEIAAAKAFGGGFYGDAVKEETREVYRRKCAIDAATEDETL